MKARTARGGTRTARVKAASARGGPRPLSDRLLAVLDREVSALEGGAETGEKGRIDAIALATRTLEKLIELRRLEAPEAGAEPCDEAEARRLREELMRRLRLVDAARGHALMAAEAAARG